MAESNEGEKVQLHGRRRSFKLWFKRGKGTVVGGSSQVVELTGQQPGVTYTVISTIEPMTFKKKRDALQFKALIKVSKPDTPADIVRREIDQNGFEI